MARITNGSGNHPAGEPLSESVVTVNFGLTWKHILSVTAMIITGLGSLATAGWLVTPAKQTDLTRVEQKLEKIGAELEAGRDLTKRLTIAVDELTQKVKLIRVDVVRKPKRRVD